MQNRPKEEILDELITDEDIRMGCERVEKTAADSKFESWSDERIKETWSGLGGSHTECMKNVKGVDSPEKYCAALKDRVEGTTYWRGKKKTSQGSEKWREALRAFHQWGDSVGWDADERTAREALDKIIREYELDDRDTQQLMEDFSVFEWRQASRKESLLFKGARIVQEGGKYCVKAETGRNMGCYDSKGEAEKRLQQVEMFKHMKESRRLTRRF